MPNKAGLTLFAVIACILLIASTASGAIGIDQTVSKDQGSASATVAAGPFSTTAGNELLLAFVDADGPSSGTNTTVSSIATPGLTWVLVQRTNTQRGTGEIWRAFAALPLTNVTVTATLSQSESSSLTVMSFTGVDTSGTNGSGAIGNTGTGNASTGAPTASLTTTRNGSLVIGVGNDWDNAISRTPGPNQTVVHQFLSPVGDTYWVQRQTNPTAASGTVVTISDTAPTGDRYDLSIAEVRVPVASSTITATAGTPQSATVNTTFVTNLQATVRDGSNNPVVGTTVTFTVPGSGASGSFAGGANTAVTNSSGVATAAALTANTTAGGYTVTATASGVTAPASFLLTNSPGAAASVTATAGTPQSTTINTLFATNLQVVVKDTYGNAVSGATVTFTAPASGASGAFAGGANSAVTNSSGIATAAQFTANGVTGGYTVAAAVSGATSASFSLANNPPPPASIAATAGTPQSATINTAFTTALQATVKDASNNPLSGVTVTFTAPAGGASGTFTGGNTAVTNSSGVATAGTFTANSTAGSYTVSASVSGVSISASFNLTNTPGLPASVIATAGTPQSATINTAFATNLQATVKDAGNNGVPGVTVTFTAPGSGASGTFASGINTATTNGSGVAAAQVFTANGTAGGPYTVTAAVSGATSGLFSLTNTTAQPASVTATAGTPQSATVNAVFGTALQATVKDASNNPVSGVTVTFADPVSGPSGTFGGSTGVTTNSSGVAIAPPFTANSIAGSYTVTASVSGVSTPANFSLTNNPGPAASISGTISPPLGSATKLTLSGTASTIVVTDSNGNYIFTGLTNGSYTVTPSKSYEAFNPGSQSVTINGANASGINFTASPTGTFLIFGTVGPATTGAGTLLTLSGTVSATRTADSSGAYSFSGVPNGTYTVTPSKAGVTFSPPSQSFYIANFDANPIDFTGSTVPTWSISGALSPPSQGRGALLTLNGGPGATVPADASGNFRFTGLANGTYTVTPSNTGYTFVPPSQVVTVNSGNVSANFAVQPGAPQPFNYPDFSSMAPITEMSIVTVSGVRQFQYTHDIFNGGTGPLEIQPVYNPASGTYEGFQHVYSLSPSGNWRVAQTIPIAGAFFFDPAHQHYHFPVASFGLYKMNPDGTIGAVVAVSPKDAFCIDDSFIYDTYLPNAGAFSNWVGCGDPTALRGLSIGAVDEYDQNDEGQSIPIGNLPDGTYWFRMIVDPNNFLAESDKTNNETDVKLLITGNTVQVLQTVIPVLNPPPSVSLAAPSDGNRVSGTVPLIAMTTAGQTVQFLVDGQLVGSPISSAPYSIPWNTASVPDGSHWLAAQTTDSTGLIGTSPVATVTVSNTGGVDTLPPTVTVTSPGAGSTVSSVVTIAANAADDTSVTRVQFYVDGTALGTPVTTPPYTTTWNTLAATAGTHNLSASAVDSAGLIGTSAPVSVTVDNSHPPNLIGIDATVFIDGSGTMQTPPLSPSVAGDFLVAFVAYDGPSGTPQTATVSGGGLTWTLLKRSNSEPGTAEIWAARAVGLSSITVLSQPGNGLNYHGSLTVVAFTNAAGPGLVNQAGAQSGAPDIFLPGVAAGSWVFAVGNDWDNAIGRTPVSGQVLVHQRVDTQTGDTYWVQSTTAPSTAFALVDIHDSAPTSDRWNYAAVEIVATHQ